MKIKLINNWKKFYKLWSVWIFALIAVSPEIYNQLMAMGLLNDVHISISYLVKFLAIVGITSRLVKQNESKYNINGNKEL